MSSNSERYYYLMRLAMGRHPLVDAAVTIQTLVDACVDAKNKSTDTAWVAGNQVHDTPPNGNASNGIYLSDLNVDDKYIQLLLVRGDPTVGRPNFTNIRKKSVTPATSSDPDAVPAVSSLLMVELGVPATAKGRHRVVLERAPGLGKSLVRDYVALLLRRYARMHPDLFIAEKKVRKKGEKRETIQYTPTLRLDPQQNASLKSDLERGKIGGFSLVGGAAKYEGPADQAKVIQTNVKLQVKLAPTGDLGDVFKTLRNIKAAMSSAVEFDGQYKLQLLDADDTEHNTQLLPMETLESSDMRYCRTVVANGFSGELEQCYAQFHPEIAAKAKVFFSKADYWK